VSSGAVLATVHDVAEFDVRTPYEELTELRTLLSVGEIAEMTGLRRETLSRARPDGRFQRRTAQGIADLYLVATRLRPMVDGDVHLAAVLRRSQDVLGQRSIAELLAEGKVDAVLEHLAPPATMTIKDPTADELSERLSALLAADTELAARLPPIEAALLEHFGPGVTIERKIIEPWDVADGEDEFYLRVHTDLTVREEIDRLGEFLRLQRNLLDPVRPRLTIGFL
jgi:hypothetical protein